MSKIAVVGYDASNGSEDALALALVLRRALGLHLCVASCAVDPLNGISSSYTQRVRQDAEDSLSSARNAIEDITGVEFRALHGASAAGALHELCESLGAEALVIGATHHRATAELFAPSVTHQAIQGSPCGVVVAPAGYREREHPVLRHVAVAVDATEQAHVALARAAATADQVGGRLEILHAYVPALATATLAAVSYAVPDFEKEAHDVAADQVDRSIASVRDSHPAAEVEGRLLQGPTIDELVDASEDCDLLFLGSRGYGPLRRAMLGSVSGAVVRRALCPVWVLPHHA